MEALGCLTFNLRVDTPNDGQNRWDCRKEFALEIIEAFHPQILGTQEAQAHQAGFLKERLTDHAHIGAGRDDGANRGEQNALFLERRRCQILDSGTFWLGATPQTPGSKGWDAACTRTATWVRLTDVFAGPTLTVVDTHLDHRGDVVRLEGARQVRQWLAEHHAGEPAIVLGDMNCFEDSAPIACLLEPVAGLTLTDAFRKVHGVRSKEESTCHKYHGGREGSRIDFILHTPHFVTESAEIVRSCRDGRYPSDHFPVAAKLQWK